VCCGDDSEGVEEPEGCCFEGEHDGRFLGCCEVVVLRWMGVLGCEKSNE
jgi:hypothetical protein